MNTLLQEFEPDLIISTHPFGTQMCGVLKKRGKINCKLATILTDFHIHGQWLVFNEYCDYFFVSNNQMKNDMIEYGVDENKIHVSGIPVSSRFKENFKQVKTMGETNIFKVLADRQRRDILTMLKDGRLNAGEIAEKLQVSPAALSYHLKLLKSADLISEYKEKNYIYYEVNTTVFEELILWINQFGGGKG